MIRRAKGNVSGKLVRGHHHHHNNNNDNNINNNNDYNDSYNNNDFISVSKTFSRGESPLLKGTPN